MTYGRLLDSLTEKFFADPCSIYLHSWVSLRVCLLCFFLQLKLNWIDWHLEQIHLDYRALIPVKTLELKSSKVIFLDNDYNLSFQISILIHNIIFVFLRVRKSIFVFCRIKKMQSTLDKQHDLLRLIVQKMEIRSEADNQDEGSIHRPDEKPRKSLSALTKTTSSKLLALQAFKSRKL